MKKSAVKKLLVKKPAAKKAPAKKLIVKKPAVKKSSSKAAPAKKAAVKNPAIKKPIAKKTVAKKAVAKHAVAKKALTKTIVPKPSTVKTITKKTITKTAERKLVRAAKAAKSPKPATSKKLLAEPIWSALVKNVLQTLDTAKAEQIVAVDLAGKSTIADTMVVASGRSSRHVNAIADQVVEELKKHGQKNIRIEGVPQCDWVQLMPAISSSMFSARKSAASTIWKSFGRPISCQRHDGS